MERLRPGDPEQIGPWQIVNRLGSGGMGVVYMGTNGTRSAAIKVLRDYLLDDPTSRTRLAREVEALEKVKGNYAAEIVGSDTESIPAWIATNFVDGPSLKTLVDREGPLNEKQWLEFAYGLMNALASIHALGVIHRDIKPSNILIAKDGPKLIDFGISLSGDATSLTGTGLVAGTPSWLAPEQFLGKTLTTALDNFSAGSTLVFAATGGNPWDKDDSSVAAVMHSIINNKLDIKKLSDIQKSICEKLLIKDPEQRATAAEIQDFIAKANISYDQRRQIEVETQRRIESKRVEDEENKQRAAKEAEGRAEAKKLAAAARKQERQRKSDEKQGRKTLAKASRNNAALNVDKIPSLDNFDELSNLRQKTERRRFIGQSRKLRRFVVLASMTALIGIGIVTGQDLFQNTSDESIETANGANPIEVKPRINVTGWEGLIEGELTPQAGDGDSFNIFVCDQGVQRNSLEVALTNGNPLSDDIKASLLRGDSRCGSEFDTIEITGSSNKELGTSNYLITGSTSTGFNFEYPLKITITGLVTE